MITFALVASLFMLSAPDKPPPQPLFAYGFTSGNSEQRTLTIHADGRWTALDAKDVKGPLAPEELERLRGQIEKTVFEVTVERPPSRDCSARPSQLSFVATPRGRVSYGLSCAPRADASVLALVALAESLTTHRPPPVLVRLERWRTGAEDEREFAVVMRAGNWSTERGRGELSKEALAELIALIEGATLEAPPTPMAPVCRGDFVHELEVPGRGSVKWLWPCHEPSASLGKVLDALYRATGMRAP